MPTALVSAMVALGGSGAALADESGVSFWLLGTYATQAAVPSDPGLSIDMTYYVGRRQRRPLGELRARRPRRGRARHGVELHPADADLDVRAEGARAGQASFGVTALGGNYASTVSATLARPPGRSVSGCARRFDDGVRRSLSDGHAEVEQRGQQLHDLPDRQRADRRLRREPRQATVGMGRWAIDGGLGYTYFHEERGLEFSAVAGLTYNFMNPYTAYQSGIDLHVEVSASKYLTERFLAGAAGYFYQPDHRRQRAGRHAGAVHPAWSPAWARSSATTSRWAAARRR